MQFTKSHDKLREAYSLYTPATIGLANLFHNIIGKGYFLILFNPKALKLEEYVSGLRMRESQKNNSIAVIARYLAYVEKDCPGFTKAIVEFMHDVRKWAAKHDLAKFLDFAEIVLAAAYQGTPLNIDEETNDE